MLLLFTLLLFVALDAYELSALNDFSADVDIYDMGMMGRGKNACSWHRSTANKQEVFYYLAMQPWRHLVWTDCTGSECYKYFINEDASDVPNLQNPKKLSYSNTAHDYCRKEYANNLATFDIDWDQIDEHSRLETVDVNGRTCYKYPAKQPLAYIYLQRQFTKSRDVTVIEPCRYDFIGGKSITFRSFNAFSNVFITDDKVNGYKDNKTRCNIDPTPNNVETDLAIVLGISDPNVVQTINAALSKLGTLTTVKQVKVYYISGDSLKRETVALDKLSTLGTKQVAAGSVDALINTAKDELISRINKKEIKRGTIIALMDRALTSTFDAETAFDRNNITVHTVIYNPKNDNKMRTRARALLSVGDHYHEFSEPTGISTVIDELFIGLRTNLTERCDRMTCNGFCDARDRCTCPMCCENTCFFSYCNTTTATCMPWPEANPKKKIDCTPEDCVGYQECKDLEGCVYTEYKPGCAPRAKCMKPYCDEFGKCQQESSCEKDKTPSYQNKCWSYKCNEENGNCERDKSGNECPRLTDLCYEHVCDANLKCTQQKKTCVKTAPYTEMGCYKAECNKKTGQCENVLSCDDALASFSGCGKTEGISLSQCECVSPDFKCVCQNKNVDTSGFCTAEEICDSTVEGQEPFCRKSECHQNLYVDGCEIKTCDETTGQIVWKEYDCTKKVKLVNAGTSVENKEEVEKFCMHKFEILCSAGKCLAQKKETEEWEGGCGTCALSEEPTTKNGYDEYYVTYTADCSYLKVTCPNGEEVPGSKEWFEDGKVGVCLEVEKDVEYEDDAGETQTKKEKTFECGFNKIVNEMDPLERCGSCFSSSICYKALEYREYVYREDVGECDMMIIKTEIPECSVCNEQQDGYDLLCDNIQLDRTFNYTLDGKEFKFDYTIPKICSYGDQCIPDPNFDCTDTSNGEIAKIYELFKPCANDEGVDAVYHYSSKFDIEKYHKYRPQSADFVKEADANAYCTWSFVMDPCKYCKVKGDEAFEMKDRCDDKKEEYEGKGLQVDAFTYKCNVYTDQCETTSIDVNCPPENCYYRRQKQNSLDCEVTTVWTCADHDATIKTKKARYNHPPEETALGNHYPEVVCNANFECNSTDQETCNYHEDNLPCKEALRSYLEDNKDFGCRIPTAECDFDKLHCTFKKLENPVNDTRFFQERDNVVFGDKCYNYTCHEYYNETSELIEHHWVLNESSVKELSMQPQTICDTVHCDAETGKSVSERRKCNPITDFGLSERMAQCFECACSMQTGDNVLTMRPDTQSTTFELDACGNCVVRDRATGNQINEVIECVLAQPVNLTGAIAGATVAASVVFGLIGSMVVVSIGALQTYQLVSSAMKNVISTTLENPEFVAADNEATNVLNNGD